MAIVHLCQYLHKLICHLNLFLKCQFLQELHSFSSQTFKSLAVTCLMLEQQFTVERSVVSRLDLNKTLSFIGLEFSTVCMRCFFLCFQNCLEQSQCIMQYEHLHMHCICCATSLSHTAVTGVRESSTYVNSKNKNNF